VLRYHLVMPAAGVGSRVGAAVPKQYLPLAGRAVLEWSLAPFLADPRCADITVALGANDHYFAATALGEDRRITVVEGGAERSDSVMNALQRLPGDNQDWVLVHDAARPCISSLDIDRLLDELHTDSVGGLLAIPLADTLKQADENGRVSATPSRTKLWRALTPQMFRLGPLRTALLDAKAAGRVPTDEAQAMEWCGHSPKLVRGSVENLKITETADLALAAAILAARMGAR
jgi:2-C-methyl-D-erythritol 4-phosphate cytidylyltransferase